MQPPSLFHLLGRLASIVPFIAVLATAAVVVRRFPEQRISWIGWAINMTIRFFAAIALICVVVLGYVVWDSGWGGLKILDWTQFLPLVVSAPILVLLALLIDIPQQLKRRKIFRENGGFLVPPKL